MGSDVDEIDDVVEEYDDDFDDDNEEDDAGKAGEGKEVREKVGRKVEEAERKSTEKEDGATAERQKRELEDVLAPPATFVPRDDETFEERIKRRQEEAIATKRHGHAVSGYASLCTAKSQLAARDVTGSRAAFGTALREFKNAGIGIGDNAELREVEKQISTAESEAATHANKAKEEEEQAAAEAAASAAALKAELEADMRKARQAEEERVKLAAAAAAAKATADAAAEIAVVAAAAKEKEQEQARAEAVAIADKKEEEEKAAAPLVFAAKIAERKRKDQEAAEAAIAAQNTPSVVSSARPPNASKRLPPTSSLSSTKHASARKPDMHVQDLGEHQARRQHSAASASAPPAPSRIHSKPRNTSSFRAHTPSPIKAGDGDEEPQASPSSSSCSLKKASFSEAVSSGCASLSFSEAVSSGVRSSSFSGSAFSEDCRLASLGHISSSLQPVPEFWAEMLGRMEDADVHCSRFIPKFTAVRIVKSMCPPLSEDAVRLAMSDALAVAAPSSKGKASM
jgi:hypothetical protein